MRYPRILTAGALFVFALVTFIAFTAVDSVHAEEAVMTLEEALERIPERELPDWWVGDLDSLQAHLDALQPADVREIAVSPGGTPLLLVTYGEHEPTPRDANFNSAMGGRLESAYVDRAARTRPVVLLVGPVHGHEVEGLTGLVNLISVMETGEDLRGTPRPRLRELGAACRLLIIPAGNPDGIARFVPRALQGMEQRDLRWWGQGAWTDGTLIGWLPSKTVHPMREDRVRFLGCYFNDEGINPAHDEFFAPMGPEAPAILDVARDEAPDFAALLHSHESPAAFIRPKYVPLEVQEDVLALAERTWSLYEAAGLPHGRLFEPTAEGGPNPAVMNLTSAVYHVSGAAPFTFESPHGLIGDERWGEVSFDDLLEIQMLLYEAIFAHALEAKTAQ